MLGEHKKLTARDVITGELAQHGYWVVACLDPQIAWPTSLQKVVYRGQAVFILPQFDDCYPSITVRLGPSVGTFEDAQVLILNFLSALCWVENRGTLIDMWSGSSLPRPYGGYSRSGVRMILSDGFKHHYLPDVRDEKARWALAFYREGLSMRPKSYGFLSLYKIINMLHKGGRHQKAWINANMDAAAQHEARKRLKELRGTESNIGHYLYESGRCAVAHAGHGPTVDPENPRDMRRLAEDFPLMRDLAAYAIEKEFGVKSASTVYREHLYELEGFRQIVGPAVVQRLKEKAGLRPDELPPFPRLQIGLYGEADYPALSDLIPEVTGIQDGIVYLECVSANGRTGLVIALDFPNERLLSSFFEDLVSLDDGSEQAIHDGISLMAFRRRYFLNGELIVKRADTGALLGRCDAFLPTNVDMLGTVKNFDATIERLTKLADERKAAGA